MDPTLRPPLTNQPPPPPPSTSSSSYTSFPILVITILGILTTAILLVSYYVFAVKCRLNLRRADLIQRIYSGRSRRRHFHMPPIIHAAAEVRGLEPSAIRSIPIIKFSKAGGDPEANRRSSFNECAVCLSEFQEEEKLRLLPGCSHAFHIDCIDIWLQFNANCPLCRSDMITSPMPIPAEQFMLQPPNDQEQNGSIVIEVRGDESSARTPRMEAPNPNSARPGHGKKGRKFHKVGSMGDECINVRGKDEQFCVQPIRRSFSMDSSNDRQLYLSVQEILRHNPHYCFQEVGGSGEGSSSSSGGGGGRVRRSFFSFGHRSSRSAILPFQIDQ